jgi:two-component system CheB/CheR fusion protein
MEDVKHKFYVKKPGLARVTQPFGVESVRGRRRGEELRPGETGVGTDIYREADRLLLSRYAPASVLINGDFEVIQFRGDTGAYLAPAPGKASLGLLKMLREGLLAGVRGAIHKARREEAPVREHGLRVKSNGGHRLVEVSVIPIKASNSVNQTHYLVLFEEGGPSRVEPSRPRSRNRRKAASARGARGKAEAAATEGESARLAQELAATREYLQSVIEQQEAANEELQSSNEEVQSANEELQSVNEELETAKEEIQSSNEELATVNEELHNRNTELGQANNDFLNLLSSVQLAIVMLGADLRIRRFTPMAEKLFNLIAADVG